MNLKYLKNIIPLLKDHGYMLKRCIATNNCNSILCEAQHVESKIAVALKIVSLNSKKYAQNFERELKSFNVFQEFSSSISRLLKMIESFTIEIKTTLLRTKEYGVIVLPLFEFDGIDLIRDYRPSIQNIKSLLFDICLQLNQMHHLNIVHLDIKPDNFLINPSHLQSDYFASDYQIQSNTAASHADNNNNNDNDSSSNHNLDISKCYSGYIADFGTSHVIEPASSSSSKLRKQIGTRMYMAPELYALPSSSSSSSKLQEAFTSLFSLKRKQPRTANNKHNVNNKYISMNDAKKCDVWSLGVSIFVMLTSEFPFIVEDKNYIINQSAFDALDEISQNLLSSMLRRNPSRRIDMNEVITHPFWLETLNI